jgi:hypothetical protein
MAEDINAFLDTSIDLENGFKGFLLQLRGRLTQNASRQVLDTIIDHILPKSADPLNPFPEDHDTELQYEIPSDIGPRELVERILEYENDHKRFYSNLKDMVVNTRFQETCSTLFNHKSRQIKETKRILVGMEFVVLGGRAL